MISLWEHTRLWVTDNLEGVEGRIILLGSEISTSSKMVWYSFGWRSVVLFTRRILSGSCELFGLDISSSIESFSLFSWSLVAWTSGSLSLPILSWVSLCRVPMRTSLSSFFRWYTSWVSMRSLYKEPLHGKALIEHSHHSLYAFLVDFHRNFHCYCHHGLLREFPLWRVG